jgi:outer membrane lipoprotein-sorting protein
MIFVILEINKSRKIKEYIGGAIMQINRKALNLLLTIVLITTFLASVCYSQDSSQKARSILEKMFKKYDALFAEDMKGINSSVAQRNVSAIAKMSIKGQGRLDPRSTTTPPLLMDAKIELYVTQPNKIFLNITGNMGDIQIVIPDKKPMTATTILPSTKQFATMPVPQSTFRGFQPQSREKFWLETNLTYGGTQMMKQGKVHKIIMKSTNPKLKETSIAYILDQKWDPVRFEVNDPVGGNTIVDFDEISLNAVIPPDKFIPKTSGFTQVSKEQFTGLIMMQILTSTMPNKQIK